MSGNITIFGVTFYTTGMPLLVMIILLPLATVIINKRLKKRCLKTSGPPDHSTQRIIVAKRVGLFAIVLFFAVLGDVIWTGITVHKLCKMEGGLHVYKTVEAEGFLGSGSSEWIEYGFQFVESNFLGDKFRLTTIAGLSKRTKVESFQSRYEEVGPERTVLTNTLARTRYYIKDRQTGEVLSERIYFSIYPGWLDKHFFTITGFTYSPWICGNYLFGDNQRKVIPHTELIKRTLQPIAKR